MPSYPAINDREFNLLKKIAENTADIAAGGGGGGGGVTSVNGETGVVVLDKGDIGLSNVDNTSDANKPVSTAQSAAIAAAQAAAIAASQPLDSDLTAIAALTTTAFGRAFLTQVDAASTLATLGISGSADAGGWIAGEAWTYVSATSFSVASDVTAKYAKGDRIKLTQTTVKYFYVVNVSAFGGGITTITVSGGSDFTLANAAITSPFYSKDITPNGFPQWFNWVPTLTGFSANPGNAVYRFNISGRSIYLAIRQGTDGTSNATKISFTLPRSNRNS
jgi:hypothetical protein